MSEAGSPRPSYVFVSDEGHVVGVALYVEGALRGVCLALLRDPVSISTWIDALREETDPEVAADHLVERYGGTRLQRVVVLSNATFLPVLAAGPTGEA